MNKQSKPPVLAENDDYIQILNVFENGFSKCGSHVELFCYANENLT